MLSQSQWGISRMQASIISSKASVIVSSDCRGNLSRSVCVCECVWDAAEGAREPLVVPPLEDSVQAYECSEYLPTLFWSQPPPITPPTKYCRRFDIELAHIMYVCFLIHTKSRNCYKRCSWCAMKQPLNNKIIDTLLPNINITNKILKKTL